MKVHTPKFYITLLFCCCLSIALFAGKNRGKIVAPKPPLIYVGGGANLPLGATKSTTYLTNSGSLAFDAYLPLLHKDFFSLGLNIGGAFSFDVGKPGYTLPAPFNVVGQTSSSVAYRGVDPKSPGFKTLLGPQFNFHIGNKFMISPIFAVGFMAHTQNEVSAVQTTQYNGQSYDYKLLTFNKSTSSGVCLSPKLRLTYMFHEHVGLWAEANYAWSPSVSQNVTTMKQPGSPDANGNYAFNELQLATYKQQPVVSAPYHAFGANIGVVIGLDRPCWGGPRKGWNGKTAAPQSGDGETQILSKNPITNTVENKLDLKKNCKVTLVSPIGISSLCDRSFRWLDLKKELETKYVLRIYEYSQTSGNDKLENGKLFFEKSDISETTYSYPTSAPIFQEGKIYEWSVKKSCDDKQSLGSIKEEKGVFSVKQCPSFCDSLLVSFSKIEDQVQNKGCCFKLGITNNATGVVSSIPYSFKISCSSATIVAQADGISTGWNKLPNTIPPSTNNLKWSSLSGRIANGKSDLGNLCFESKGGEPFYVVYEWADKKGNLLCKDSILLACDTSKYDVEGCDVDIDTTIVTVGCGGIVTVTPAFSGRPSLIKYTIYDTAGVVILSALNTPSYSFTLPYSGVFYGTVETNCMGGIENGGDEDIEAFEIVSIDPQADFETSSTYKCIGGICERTVTTTDYSNDGSLSYLWTVKDLSTSITTSYTVAEPNFVLDAKKKYDVALKVTNSNGCSSSKKIAIFDKPKCEAKFKWSYSWCEDCGQKDVTDVNVNFTNLSSFKNCSDSIQYLWDFGDGQTSTEATPSHTFNNLPCNGQSFDVTLTMTLGEPTDTDYCQSTVTNTVNINNTRAQISYHVCCDGLVFFATDAINGTWNTPYSRNEPRWPSVFKKIRAHQGQNYRQYYTNAGTYTAYINGAESADHNICTIQRTFTIDAVECLYRNNKNQSTVSVGGGVTAKAKIRMIARPGFYMVRSKIRTIGFKKVDAITAGFDGDVYRQDSYGCFCDPVHWSKSTTRTNKRKSVAVQFETDNKYRVGENKLPGKFSVTPKGSSASPFDVDFGHGGCDRTWSIRY
jgi:hypothetical protein